MTHRLPSAASGTAPRPCRSSATHLSFPERSKPRLNNTPTTNQTWRTSMPNKYVYRASVYRESATALCTVPLHPHPCSANKCPIASQRRIQKDRTCWKQKDEKHRKGQVFTCRELKIESFASTGHGLCCVASLAAYTQPTRTNSSNYIASNRAACSLYTPSTLMYWENDTLLTLGTPHRFSGRGGCCRRAAL